MRVTGVPYFVVGDHAKFSGAQPANMFEEVFEEVLVARLY